MASSSTPGAGPSSGAYATGSGGARVASEEADDDYDYDQQGDVHEPDDRRRKNTVASGEHCFCLLASRALVPLIFIHGLNSLISFSFFSLAWINV